MRAPSDQRREATSPQLLGVLLGAFGLPANTKVPDQWWSERGKAYGLPVVFNRLWIDSGLAAAVDKVACENQQLAESVMRMVCCAVCEPKALPSAAAWLDKLVWPNGVRTTTDDTQAALKFLGRHKNELESALFLDRRSLFDLRIQQGLIVVTPRVLVLFREGARPVAFEWVEEASGGVPAAAERLLNRFSPIDFKLLDGEVFTDGLMEVFSKGLPIEKTPGLAIAGFLALCLLAELRRRLPENLSTVEALRSLLEIRALEVAHGERRYLIRQPVSGVARRTFKALGQSVPRRVIPVRADGQMG